MPAHADERLSRALLLACSSLALLLGGTFVSVLVSLKDLDLPRGALLPPLSRFLGLAVLGGLLLYLALSRASSKDKPLVLAGVAFLFLEMTLNSLSLPWLRFSKANFFIFDQRPDFDSGLFFAADLLVLAASLALARFLTRRFSPVRLFAVLSVFGFVFLYCQANDFLRAYPDSPPRPKAAPDPRLWNFDPQKRNTLVLIADGFRGSEFSGLLADDPQIARDLAGFTFYKNTLSVHAGTWGSICEMVGGPDFALRKLSKRRFWVAQYGDARQRLERDLARIGSGLDFVLGEDSVADRADPERLFRLASWFSFLKLGPSFIKQASYRFIEREDQQVEAGMKWDFLITFLNRMRKGRSDRVKLFHVQVPHPPNFIPAGCEFPDCKDQRYVPADYRQDARCLIRYVAQLGRKLRAMGVWDNTEIIVVSDHGWPGRAADLDADQRFTRTDFGMAHALLLMKPAHAQPAFRVDTRNFLTNADLYRFLCGSFNHCSGLRSPLGLEGRVLDFFVTDSADWAMKEHFQVKDNIFDKANWTRVE